MLPFSGPGHLALALVGGRGRMAPLAYAGASATLAALGLAPGEGADEVVIIDAGPWGRAWAGALAGDLDGDSPLLAAVWQTYGPLRERACWRVLTVDGAAVLDVPLAGALVYLDKRWAGSCCPVRIVEIAETSARAGAAVAVWDVDPLPPLLGRGWGARRLGPHACLTLSRRAEHPAIEPRQLSLLGSLP